MTQYDIASKVLIENCRDPLIRHFLKLDVAESKIIEELPQQTASLRSSDFPVMVTDGKGEQTLAVMEIQSKWENNVPLRALEYRTRYLLKYGVKTVTCILLLKKGAATDVYEDNEVTFHFHLVKIYELDAKQVLDEGFFCLMPFVPLMKNGPELTFEADKMIYQGDFSRIQKADMLTSLAILSGLVSNSLPVKLIQRRRDIMIESAAYDIIKKEGWEEGMKEGKQEFLFKMLEGRFGTVPISLKNKIKSEESDKIYLFAQSLFEFQSLDEVEKWWNKEE